MKRHALGLLLLASAFALPLMAQMEYEFDQITATDTFSFWMQTPANYNPANPPAILVWWHSFGDNRYELRDRSRFDEVCLDRGWISASFWGPYQGKHYQCRRGLHHADSMLNWAMSVAPFSMDSIYMVGSSMGAAAGEIWHNNNCGFHDYMPAAVAGGSPILDCELRQQQYVDSGHILVACSTVFGGLPWAGDSIAYQYHRSSAVHFADTSESMHFNSNHLPVYYSWGTSDSCWTCEWFAYGRPCQNLDTLRRTGGADTTVVFCSGLNGHGVNVLNADSVVAWLSGFSARRLPVEISINADENDEYYWTRVELGAQPYTMGRYGVVRNPFLKRIDINLIRNVAALDVEFLFPWPPLDTIRGNWINRDSLAVTEVTIRLTNLATRVLAIVRNGVSIPFSFEDGTLSVSIPPSGDYVVILEPQAVEQNPEIPVKIKLVTAYPNPFNASMTLEVESRISIRQEIRLFDLTGRLAKTITADLNPGSQRIIVSADGLASGIYFLALPNSGQAPVKAVLLK